MRVSHHHRNINRIAFQNNSWVIILGWSVILNASITTVPIGNNEARTRYRINFLPHVVLIYVLRFHLHVESDFSSCNAVLFCKWNPQVWSFKWQLLRSAFLWFYLIVNIFQTVDVFSIKFARACAATPYNKLTVRLNFTNLSGKYLLSHIRRRFFLAQYWFFYGESDFLECDIDVEISISLKPFLSKRVEIRLFILHL